MPCSFNPNIRSSKCLLSSSFKAAVGSSRIRRSTFFASALAISINCCFPTPKALIGKLTFSFSNPTFARTSSAFFLVTAQSTTPFTEVCSLPRKIFSATDRSGLSASSWWIITIPFRSLSLMLWNLQISPLYTISPE